MGVGKLAAPIRNRRQERYRELIAKDLWRNFEQKYIDEKPLLILALINKVFIL